MKTKRIDRLMLILAALAGLWSCAPQVRYFNVDVRHDAETDIDLTNLRAAVFPVFAARETDSLLACRVGIGLAEKLESDRRLASGEVPVYGVPEAEYRPDEADGSAGLPDTGYLTDIAERTGADLLLFVDRLSFRNPAEGPRIPLGGEYGMDYLLLPFSVDLHVYDAAAGSLLYSKSDSDTAYVQTAGLPLSDPARLNGTLQKYLPDIAGKIGARLASYLTPQWETRERMLIVYGGSSAWERPCELAGDFKWKEAIELWMPLAASESPRKAACAAYNIAVGCEMLEQFELAEEWIRVALEKYPFREAYDLQNHLSRLRQADRP